MNVTFLFWNLRGNHKKSHAARAPRLLQCIRRFAERGVQVFLFAEFTLDAAKVTGVLNDEQFGHFYRVPARSRRVAVFSNLQSANWSEKYYDAISDRITVQELQVGRALGILLIGAHLFAPPLGLAGRAEWARELAKDIRKVEIDAGHSRTVLAGDLNMNPFDAGLVETSALHAVMTKYLATSVQALDSRKDCPPFYNPMWSCFGDWQSAASDLPNRARSFGGTYFYNQTNDRANHFWQVYDQVLLRPQLMDQLVQLNIVGSDGVERLTSRSGRPRSASLSDHLPIMFTIELR